MFGLLVVSHGRVAEELVDATKRIVGEVDGLEAISIGWGDGDVDRGQRRMEEAIRSVDRGQGVLVLTDMFGGTPTNLALSMHEPGHIEIVTGVNLPMLIKFANLRERLDLHATARLLAGQGRQAIQVASDVLESSEIAPEESAK